MQAVAHAALRSIKSLTFTSENEGVAEKMQAQLSLFPLLTALRVETYVGHFDLPSSLRSLYIMPPYINIAIEAETQTSTQVYPTSGPLSLRTALNSLNSASTSKVMVATRSAASSLSCSGHHCAS